MQKQLHVRFQNFEVQWLDIRNDVISAVERVGSSGVYILNKEVKEFEIQLAEYCKIPYVVGCGNGLDAIEIALRCLGLEKGEKVLTTPLSAFATSLAIIRAGGIPVFLDVDDTGLIDLELVEEYIKKERIKYFIPVHLYGIPVNLELLEKLATNYGLKIVEDCAQAIGATYLGRMVGTIGEINAISFYPTKNLGCLGDGGAVLTSSKENAHIARCLRDYGQESKYVHSKTGMNSRLDEMQAAILTTALLPRLKDFTEKRQLIAEKYKKNIKSPFLIGLQPDEKANPVWHLFPLLVKDKRDYFINYLRSMGVDTAIHYPTLIPDQKAMKETGFVVPTPLNKARFFSEHEVSIPINPYLSEDEVNYVIEACNSWNGF